MNNQARTRTIMVLLAIVMMGSLYSTSVVKADSLQITSSNTYLVAGQENEITLNLKNIGDRNVVDIQAILSSATPGISILEGSQTAYTVITDKSTKTFKPVIYVDKDLPLGSYTLTLTVTYQKITFEYVSATVSIGVVVSEVYTPKLGYTVDQEDISVTAGENDVLSYVFRNLSESPLYDLEFNLASTSPYITVIGGDSISVESLTARQTATIYPTLSILENTPLTTYTLTVSISFTDDDGNSYFETYYLPVNVNAAKVSRTTTLSINEIDIIPDSVHPGDTFDLDVNIECSGADAYDIMSTITILQTTPLSPISPSTVNLGDLSAGQSTDAVYTLLVAGDASAGQYYATITITYTSSKGVAKVLTETATILIDGWIEFDLLDTPTVVAEAGETHELEADLLLIGTESVEFVSIGVVEDDVIQRVSGSDEYIGAVDPDSPIPFDVNYKVSSDAPEGEHEMMLAVKYRDHLNREHEEQISLSITIGSTVDETTQTQQTGFWVWIRRLFGLGP